LQLLKLATVDVVRRKNPPIYNRRKRKMRRIPRALRSKLLTCVAHHCVAPADLRRFNCDFPSVVLARLAEEPMKHPALTYRWFAHRVRSRRLGFTRERRWEGFQRLGFLGVPA
jgi:hypothetical protein